jgi:3',5'-cyclic AMP phosphodiesterase CpdA
MPAKFEGPYGELLRRGVSFRAVLGNHDVRKGRETQINYPKFNMGGRLYYSFTKGDGLVEFFALDSNYFDNLQRRWLEVALMASRAKWKVAYFHHPIYSSADRHGSDVDLRSELEPLLVRYGVDAAFSGHDHIYERTRPQKGIQYFVSGAGSKPRRGDLDRRTPFFAAGNDETSSFMSIEVTPERFSFKTIDAGGRVIDSGELAPRAAAHAATLGR